jgi:hypothetical protein
MGSDAIPTYHRGERNYGTGYDMMKRIDELEVSLRQCVNMLRSLVAESGRSIEWGEEDAFRMGEWFEKEHLEAIAAARAILDAKP